MEKLLEDFYKSNRDAQRMGYEPQKGELYSKWIGKGKTLLDIGCNNGISDIPLLNNDNIVYGIDIVEENVREAQARGVKAICLDITKEELPFADNFFDAILAAEIIEHIFDTDGVMRKLHRKLKKNGLLILTTPNLASLGRRLLLLFGRNPWCEYSLEEKICGAEPAGHIRYFVKRDLIRFLNKHGFRVELCMADQLNIGCISSRFLAKLFPSFGCRFIVKAIKV